MAPIEEKLMIGSQAGGVAGMVTVDSLGIRTKAFEATPVHFSRYLTLGDGTLHGQGYKQAEWHLNGIRDAHWELLEAFKLYQSTWVYIRTYGFDGKTFENYLALMHWTQSPVTRDHDTNVVLDFNLSFTHMVLQP